MKASGETLLITSLAGWIAIACLVYLRTHSVLPSVVLSGGFIPVPLAYVFANARSVSRNSNSNFPRRIDMLVSALKVGHSLVTGIGALGQDSAEPMAGNSGSCSTNRTSAWICVPP